MKSSILLPIIATVCSLTLASCSGDDSPAQGPDGKNDGGKLTVYAVNYPLAYFAERIGGELVTVNFPAPTDVDPAFWSPEPETIAEYQTADLILLNGAGYAQWTTHASLPGSRLVDTSAASAASLIAIDDAVTHGHGPEGEHSHGGLAFTTWLDPKLAVAQARAVFAALEARRPEQASELRGNFEKLEAELLELDGRLAAIFAAHPEEAFLGSHPVYQYLRGRFELKLVSVHFEPDEAPTEQMWQELAKLREPDAARFMLWEGEPLPGTRERLELMGVTCVVFDPAGNVPEEGDFLGAMQGNADRLEAALR